MHLWYLKLTGGLALKLCILGVAEYIEQWTAYQRWSLGRQAMRIIVARESGAIEPVQCNFLQTRSPLCGFLIWVPLSEKR